MDAARGPSPSLGATPSCARHTPTRGFYLLCWLVEGAAGNLPGGGFA